MKFKPTATLVAMAAIVVANAFSCSSGEPTLLYEDELGGLFSAGSVRLALTVGGANISSVTAVISAKRNFVTQTHTIDVTGDSGVVSIFFGDLPAQRGYTIELTAGQCKGSANFNISADQTTLVPVEIRCPGQGDGHHDNKGTGSAQVTGTIIGGGSGAGPDCNLVTKMVAAPSTQNGNSPLSTVELVLEPGVSATNITWTQSSANNGLGVIGGLVGTTDREVTFDCTRDGTVAVTAAITATGSKSSCTEQARVSIQCTNTVVVNQGVCGDGLVNGTETCDGLAGVGSCPAGTTGTVTCINCQRNLAGCTGITTCGNGALDSGEQCDGPLGVGVCPAGTAGTVTCNAGICTRNTAGCVTTCGNGVVDTGETCDGTLGVGSCPAGTTGTVTCLNCQRNTTQCLSTTCGNGNIEAGETCDGVLGVGVCPAGTQGTVTCVNCQRNLAGCTTNACGNGALDAGEQCDGVLGVGTCPVGQTGTVTCSSSCTRVTTGCTTAQPGCGNGVIDASLAEECDGTVGVGICPGGTSGTVSCNPTTCKRNLGQCFATTCGNGSLQTDEQCDGPLGVGSCPTGQTGTVTCNQYCQRILTGCTTTTCGNGALDTGEQCDGALGVGTCPTGQTGTVTCTSSCTRNTGGCIGGPPESGDCHHLCVEDTVANGICSGFFAAVGPDSDPTIDCVFGTAWPAPDRFDPTKCVNNALTSCMCGTTVPANCFTTANPALLADAPCLTTMIQQTGCGTEPVANQVNCVSRLFVDPTNATGRAMAYAQCLQDNCGDICFSP